MLFFIIYIDQMGKKLRNREILSDTDNQNDQQISSIHIESEINLKNLRKKVKSQLRRSKVRTVPKQKKFIHRVQSNQIRKIFNTQMFQCPICLQLMINPVMMNCGHGYCYRCLESNAAYSEKCCLCRSQQQDQPHIPFKIVEKLLEEFVLPESSDYIRYLCRTTDSMEWAKRRKINNWRLGLVIDFQDRSRLWRRGVMVKIENTHIEVKINIKGIDLFQRVEKTSRRLAPFTFFTRGRYLEDFPTCLPQYDKTQKQLDELEYRVDQSLDNSYGLPIDVVNQQQQAVDYGASSQDEALRIFNFQMNEINSMLFS